MQLIASLFYRLKNYTSSHNMCLFTPQTLKFGRITINMEVWNLPPLIVHDLMHHVSFIFYYLPLKAFGFFLFLIVP